MKKLIYNLFILIPEAISWWFAVRLTKIGAFLSPDNVNYLEDAEGQCDDDFNEERRLIACSDIKGILYLTENTMKKSAANREYFTTILVNAEEDWDVVGDVDVYMFTEKELDRALNRSKKNPEDLPQYINEIFCGEKNVTDSD